MTVAVRRRRRKAAVEPSAVVLEKRYKVAEAHEYVQRALGVPIDRRVFRSWAERGKIPAFRNPGARGHYFFVKAQLDEIVATFRRQRG